MKKIISIIKYILLIIPNILAATLFNWVLAPIVVTFSYKDSILPSWLKTKEEGWLPNWLWWFQTPDNSLDANDGHSRFPVGSYWRRLGWLYRNPMYGFDENILGATLSANDEIKVFGNLKVRNRPQGESGAVLIFIGKYFFLRVVIKITKTFCLDLQFGWKLQRYAEYPNLLVNNCTAQYTFSPLPRAFA